MGYPKAGLWAGFFSGAAEEKEQLNVVTGTVGGYLYW
jgi:hypothetical protein